MNVSWNPPYYSGNSEIVKYSIRAYNKSTDVFYDLPDLDNLGPDTRNINDYSFNNFKDLPEGNNELFLYAENANGGISSVSIIDDIEIYYTENGQKKIARFDENTVIPTDYFVNVYDRTTNSQVFKGRFTVQQTDNSYNVVHFYDVNNNPETDLLETDNYYGADYGFVKFNSDVPNSFSRGGINIRNNATLSSIYPNADKWQFTCNNINTQSRLYLSYHDSSLGYSDPNNPNIPLGDYGWSDANVYFVVTKIDGTIITTSPLEPNNITFNVNLNTQSLDLSWEPPLFVGIADTTIARYRLATINDIIKYIDSNVTSINYPIDKLPLGSSVVNLAAINSQGFENSKVFVRFTISIVNGQKILTYNNVDTIISATCFPANTPVKTDQGIVAISKVDPTIHTIRNKKINFVTETIFDKPFLVEFKANSLAKNIPSEDTVMTPTHKVFYKGHMIKAEKFVDKIKGVTFVNYNGCKLYNILLDEHEKMIVNNMIVETLHPENRIAKIYRYFAENNISGKEKNEYIETFNKACREINREIMKQTKTCKK